jgi:acetyltransferase-like isoleucine patch superfamily enzyme
VTPARSKVLIAARHVVRELAAFRAAVRLEAAVEGTLIPPVRVRCDEGALVRIGAGSVIHPYSELDIAVQPGGNARCGLVIGAHTTVGTGANLRGSGGVITIGDGCLIGQHVSVIAASHGIAADRPIRDQPWSDDPADVLIEDDVHIGAGAVVLPGAVVHRGAVVAAGAVVRGEVEPYGIVAGVPARLVGHRG